MKLELVATFFGGLISGILFRSFINLGLSFTVLLALISVALFSTWRLNLQVDLDLKWPAYISLFLLAVALGIFRYDQVDTKEQILNLANFENRTVQAEGVITDEPKEKDKTTTISVSVAIGGGQEFNVLILTKSFIKYKYGDRIKIYGRLEQVKNFSDSFDYAAYLAKDEIYYQFLNPKISFISSGDGSFIQEKLFDLKNSFLEKINSVIGEPEASLMGGIILGAKSSLDSDLTNDFKRAGLIHIVALSGYNVTVVVDSLMKLVWFFPLPIKLCVGSFAVILFAMMTGGGSTVVRASLMVLLAMLARATGRIYLVGSALIVAAALMIFYNPKILVFDISFQLSFLATAGLIFFTPILEKRLNFVTDRFGLREALVSTLSAQLAVWPIILYKMGNFSVVSIPANLFVGPIVPLAMFFGFVTGLAGYVNYYLSLIFSYPSYFLLLYIVKITELFSSLPFALLTASSFPLIFTVVIYAVYIVVIVIENAKSIDSQIAR